MDWREFVASLVESLAWPGAVAVVALLFRKQIVTLLSTGLHRVKAGPIEVEWSRAERQVPASVREAARNHAPDSLEAASASISPRVAILTRHGDLMKRLGNAVTQKLGEQPPEQTTGELIGLAEENELIDATTREALVGITVMSNLAAHEPHEMAEERAREFMALADAVEYAMTHRLKRGGT